MSALSAQQALGSIGEMLVLHWGCSVDDYPDIQAATRLVPNCAANRKPVEPMGK